MTQTPELQAPGQQPSGQKDKDEFYACLWQVGERAFQAGIVGTGPGFMSVIEFIHTPQYREFTPDIRLVAVAEPDYNMERLERLTTDHGVTVHATFEDMLAAHPDIDLVIELTGKPHRVSQLRRTLPSGVSLIDHTAAVFLCSLHAMFQARTHCQRTLDHQRALLEAITDKIRDDIMVLDTSRRLEDANTHVLERAGLAKKDAMGLPCHEIQKIEPNLCHCCDGPDPACPFFETLRTKEKAEAMMTRVGSDGLLRYYRVYAYPVISPLGTLEHVLIMRRDITTRTRREKHQQQSEKLAIIGEMSTYLAHEIRNPLCAIGGFSNVLLRSENLTDDQREKLAIIAGEARRLENMLTSVLNFARPSRSGPGEADLNLKVEQTVELMRVGYGRNDIVFVLDLDQHLPRVQCEGETIKQCLVSMLRNSIEAMPHGGTVTMHTALRKDMVVLEVSDTGSGMDKSQLENAMSPFFSTKERGYGLGLAMIKKAVEEVGGSVAIASRRDQGTIVTLSFMPVLATGNGGSGNKTPADAPQEDSAAR